MNNYNFKVFKNPKQNIGFVTITILLLLIGAGGLLAQDASSHATHKIVVRDGQIVSVINLSRDALLPSHNDRSVRVPNSARLDDRDAMTSPAQPAQKGLLGPETIIGGSMVIDSKYVPQVAAPDNDGDKENIAPIGPVKHTGSANSPATTVTIMTQTFEGAFPGTNWSVSAQAGKTDAYWDDSSGKYYGGGWSGYCADGGTASVSSPGPYPNNMDAWAIYGPFDLSDATAAELNFNYWNESESTFDYFKWMFSIDGSSYSGWQTSGNSGGGSSAAWVNKTVSLDDIYNLGDIRGESAVYLAFVFQSDGSVGYEGAYIDDIVLTKTTGAAQPDLVWTSMALSTESWVVGNNITASLIEENTGTVAAGAHSTQLYMSTNTIISTADVALGTAMAYTSIAAGATQMQQKVFAVPNETNGTYYVGAIVDINSDVAEEDENNNYGYRSGTITLSGGTDLPDLSPVSIALSTESWTVGGSVTADVVEGNSGVVAAGAHSSQLYLSENTAITTLDTPLGTAIAFTAIAAGGTQTQQKVFTVPNVIDGTYYVGIIVDSNFEVAETDENNNASYRTGTVTVSGTTGPSVQQDIALTNGWNLISLFVDALPADMMSIFQPLIDAGKLVKVQDEGGLALENPTGGGWTNNIGTIGAHEGYYVKVNADATLSTSGAVLITPMVIDLSQGWNIISYPVEAAQDAYEAVATLVSAGTLLKLQDETGAALENLPGVGWINSIGNFEPGEGYYLKVTQSTSITITAPSTAPPAYASLIPATSNNPVHFVGSGTGHPFEPMNIYLLSDNWAGLIPTGGCEIGAFDGDLLVGSIWLDQAIAADEVLMVVAGMDDPSTPVLDGFTAGHAITMKLWDGIRDVNLSPEAISSDYALVFAGRGTAIGALEALAVVAGSNVPTEYSITSSYPNPFNPSTRVRIDLPEESAVLLEVYDLRGAHVRTIAAATLAAGTHEFVWRADDDSGRLVPSGVYFYMLQAGSFSAVQKVLYLK